MLMKDGDLLFSESKVKYFWASACFILILENPADLDRIHSHSAVKALLKHIPLVHHPFFFYFPLQEAQREAPGPPEGESQFEKLHC